MNENLNLVEILKDCPRGTKLYSTVFGEVEFKCIEKNAIYPIIVRADENTACRCTADGRTLVRFYGECTLFPSRTQRNWAEFKPKKPKFDPKTLQPYMRVLVRDRDVEHWSCGLFSHIVNDEYLCIGSCYKHCIPYNDDTKHLVGTTEEAPEFYDNISEKAHDFNRGIKAT